MTITTYIQIYYIALCINNTKILLLALFYALIVNSDVKIFKDISLYLDPKSKFFQYTTTSYPKEGLLLHS